ncbi:hypothetical protein M569_10926, partial [Genlisea aurea]
GGIAEGNDADIAVWDPEADLGEVLFMKHPSISAYVGIGSIVSETMKGQVLATFVRGNLVYRRGNHAASPCGRVILSSPTPE